MNNPFTEHPNSVNQTYLQHLQFALSAAIRFLISAMFFIAHAVFPFLKIPKPFDLVSISEWLNLIRKDRGI